MYLYNRSHKRLKRLISYDDLPEAQRKLFQRLKENYPDLFQDSTPPPSPLSQERFEEDQSVWGAGSDMNQHTVSEQCLQGSEEFDTDEADTREENEDIPILILDLRILL